MSERIVPIDYQTINDAAQACEQGDTIIVLPGTYYEKKTVVINKDHITVRGEGADVIIGKSFTEGRVLFDILSNHVVLRNLTVKDWNKGTGFKVCGNHVTIEDCQCMHNKIVITGNSCIVRGSGLSEAEILLSGDGHVIRGNQLNQGKDIAIVNNFMPLSNTIIEDNFIKCMDDYSWQNWRYGIWIGHPMSKDILIRGNNITAFTGIYLIGTHLTLEKNILSACNLVGIQLGSAYNVLRENAITGGLNGVVMMKGHNTLEKNIIGYCEDAGLTLVADGNVIESNLINSCTVGIRDVGQDNIIRGNQYFDNGKELMGTYE